MKYFTVILETFDGHQYGLLPIAVLEQDEESAKRAAIKIALDDGWERVKVQMCFA